MDLPEPENLLAQPTRARLFAALERLKRPASTEELAAEVGLHVNGVRRQLSRMQRGGLLERSRSAGGRGRPRDEWTISPGASPRGGRPEAYADLSRWLARSLPAGATGLRGIEETGREIGRELAPAASGDLAASFDLVFTAMGFQPAIDVGGPGRLSCSLGNCPYRASVRENPEAICTLHRGITEGLLDELDPTGRLLLFEPHDPDRAGCRVEVTDAASVEAVASVDG